MTIHLRLLLAAGAAVALVGCEQAGESVQSARESAGDVAESAADVAEEIGVTDDVPAYIEAAIAATSRPEQHAARDADRKPGRVLAFSGVKPGDKTADLGTGSGYYAILMNDIVGADGRVYAINWDWIAARFPETQERFNADVEANAYPNIDLTVQPADGFSIPEQLDVVISALAYHDANWAEIGVDPDGMNAAAFAALKPGGVYVVIDHAAEDGSGARDVDAYHRIDPELVKEQVLAAGFTLEAESDVLRNGADPKNISVFNETIRGKTDRFVFKFRKPANG